MTTGKQAKDYSCPTCGARNMEIDLWDRPIIQPHRTQDILVGIIGTAYCPVCSWGGNLYKGLGAPVHVGAN